MEYNATLKSIAKTLGISISTVSRALNDNPRIGLKTKESVKELAKKFNYYPNINAINLLKKQVSTIGIIVPTLREEFFSYVIAGAEKVARAKGIQLVVSQSHNSKKAEIEITQSYIKSRVDGVLTSVSAETNEYSHFSLLNKSGIHTVFFDRVPRNLPANKVRSEIDLATLKIMLYLYSKNFRRIALLNGPSNLQVSDERLNAYLEAIQNLKLSTSPDYIKSTDLSIEDTTQRMHELVSLTNKPEAIVCFNDYVALHCIKACQTYSLVPNKDIYFVSLTYIGITQFTSPKPLASIDLFPEEIGTKATELLIDSLEGKKQKNYTELFVKTELVINEEIK